MKEELRAFTREEYEETCALIRSMGHAPITKWRKGLKSIRLPDLVLREGEKPLDLAK